MNLLEETTREWERVTEVEMKRVTQAIDEHNVACSSVFSGLLQHYVKLFNVGHDFSTAISPDLDEFLSFAKDVSLAFYCPCTRTYVLSRDKRRAIWKSQ